MQFKTISYSKVFNLGDYQNHKIGVEVEVNEGDDPIMCHMEAVRYVENAHRYQKDFPQYERAKEIAASPQDYTGRQVLAANEAINQFETRYKDFLSVSKLMPVLESSETDDDRGF